VEKSNSKRLHEFFEAGTIVTVHDHRSFITGELGRNDDGYDIRVYGCGTSKDRAGVDFELSDIVNITGTDIYLNW
jgi:hypothetical protein